MKLTLNDFRNILGRVNDGDVVFTRNNLGQATGIEKANYGKIFKHNRQNPSHADNIAIRTMFAAAISDASNPYGRTAISTATLNAIKAKLGIVNGAGPQPEVVTTPLGRREIKAILAIVDGSCEQIKIDDELLKDMGAGIDTAKRNQFAKSVNESPLLSGKNDLKTVLGPTFLGFKRSAVAACVGKNLAHIKALTLDEMTWHHKGTGQELGVADAFKLALGKMLHAFGQGRMPVTRTRQLFAAPPAVRKFDANEDNADEFFANQKLLPEADIDALLTDDAGECTDAFSKLVLSRAKGYLVNSFRQDFQDCITNNGNSAQKAQAHYESRTSGIRRELAEFANDVKNLALIDKANLAKFRAELARNIAETFRGVDPSTFGAKYFRDVFTWAIRNTVAPFSMRALAGKFADDAAYEELKDCNVKVAYIDDFNGRMAKLADNSEVKAKIALWQSQAFNAVLGGKPVPAPSADLKNELDGKYLEFISERDVADPQKLRERRQARNRNAAISVLKRENGEAAVNAMSADGLNAQIRRTYLNFYRSVHGFYSLKKENMGDLSTAEEDARVLPWLESISDDEIAFLKKFCLLGLHEADKSLQKQYYESTKNKLERPPLYTALRDAGADFNDISPESASALKTILELGLSPYMNNGRDDESGTFLNMMNVDNDRLHTRENCVEFVKKLREEVATYSSAKNSQEKRRLLSDNEMDHIEHGVDSVKMAKAALKRTGCLTVSGFGTFDLLKILKFLKLAGIGLKDFSCADQAKRAETCARTLTLMHFATHNNYDLDSLPEYIQRVTGKDVTKVAFSDYLAFADVAVAERDVIKPGNEGIVNFITGKVKLSEAGLTKDDVGALSKALAAIRGMGNGERGIGNGERGMGNGERGEATVKVMGKTLTLTLLPDGGVRASLKTGDNAGDFKLYRFAQKADDLARAIDDIIIANAKDYSKGAVLSVLPPLPDTKRGESLMRAREVYAKTICAIYPTKKVGDSDVSRSPVDYASVPTDVLRQLAVDAVEGKKLPALDATPQTFNSAEMIEMHKNMVDVPLAEVDRKVKIQPDTTRRSEESRRNVAPSADEFRAIVADLFLNEDTWAFDSQVGANPGERIRKLMLANSLELKFVLDDIEKFIEYIDADIRTPVKAILEKLKAIPAESLQKDLQGNIAAGVRDKLAEVETLVDDLVGKYADTMQEKVTALFGTQKKVGEERSLQYQTFAEISGNASINPNTAEGQFTLAILNGYFTKSARVDQRAMLAAMVRNTDGNSTDAKKVAELLKGAGPLLQKLLQGLPISAFNKDTQQALDDMKSRLAPIPAEAVKSQLLELVNSSNGEIRSIEVKKVLGAATVGEALLCHVKTKDSPVVGMDCVIKVLRPNIYTAVLREKAIFDEIIKTSAPKMEKSFEIRYKGILKEFDLTIEADNVRLGRVHYEHPSVAGTPNLEISSMSLVENMSPTTGTLVLKKAEGVTYDQYIRDVKADVDEAVAPLEKNAVEVNGRVVRSCDSVKEFLATRRRLEYLKAYLGTKRNYISDFARVWFENGIFGNGFMHGDLHAGNIMVSDKGATIIDFGNCIRLTDMEQEKIRSMVTKASIGFGEEAIETFRELLGEEARKKLDTLLANKKKDPHCDEFKKNLYGVFKKGTSADVMARIYAAMNLMQREGVELPGSVTSFFQSYSRLNDIYETMTAEMERIDGMIDSLVLGEKALPQVGEGAPQMVKDFLALVRGISPDPYKGFDFDSHAAIANKFATDELHALKDENGNYYGGEENVAIYRKPGNQARVDAFLMMVTRREEANATIVPFLEWLLNLEIPKDSMLTLKNGAENADANEFDYTAMKRLRTQFENYKKNSGADLSPFASDLPQLMEYYALALAGIMDGRPRKGGNANGLGGVKEARDKPIFEVCGDVVSAKLADKSPVSLFRTFMAEFPKKNEAAFAIRESKRFANKLDTRKDFAVTTLEDANDKLGDDLRLTKEKRRIVMRQMESFAWPFDGAWVETPKKGEGDDVEKPEISFPKEKWPVFIEALVMNLNDLKTALGFAPAEKLPPEIAKLAVTYIAQIDPRAALAVKSLAENDYNMLIASVGNHSDSAMLDAAIGALKDAPDDEALFEKYPEARQEFAEIDEDADTFDPSLKNIVKMGLKYLKNS